MKHKIELLAEEWVNNNPNPKMKDLAQFNNQKDLKTMIRIVLSQNYQLFHNDGNKNELTNLDKIQAIEEYADFPHLFLNFCTKDLYTIDHLYKMKKHDLAKNLLDDIINEEFMYIDSLLKHYIFEKTYGFQLEYYLKPSSIKEFVINIDPLIADMKNIQLSDDSVKPKMMFYQIDEFISINTETEDLENGLIDQVESIKDLNCFKGLNNDEIFLEILPPKISVNGLYVLSKNQVDYKIQRNVLSFISDRTAMAISRIEKAKDEKNKKVLQTSLQGLSLASAFFIPALAVKIATSQAIVDLLSKGKNIIEGANNVKDLVEFSKYYIGDYLNLDNCLALYKLYQESKQSSFKVFFVDLLKNEINYFLHTLLKQEIHIPDSIFEDVYQQFFQNQINPIFNDMMEDKKLKALVDEQIVNFDDSDKNEYIINVVLNSNKNDLLELLV